MRFCTLAKLLKIMLGKNIYILKMGKMGKALPDAVRKYTERRNK